MKVLNLYNKQTLSKQDKELIENAIDCNEIDTDEIFDDFVEWVKVRTNIESVYITSFREFYSNLLSHKENSNLLVEIYNQL